MCTKRVLVYVSWNRNLNFYTLRVSTDKQLGSVVRKLDDDILKIVIVDMIFITV